MLCLVYFLFNIYLFLIDTYIIVYLWVYGGMIYNDFIWVIGMLITTRVRSCTLCVCVCLENFKFFLQDFLN